MATGFQGDPPIVVALLTCDQASVGVPPFGVNKLSLSGLYDSLMTPQLPLTHLLTVYAAVMDFQEPFTLSVRLVPPSEPLGSKGLLFGESQLAVPAATGETGQVIIQNFTIFPEAGRYEVHVYGNGAYLAHKPLFVRQVQIQPTLEIPR